MTAPAQPDLRQQIADAIAADLKKAAPPIQLFPGGHQLGGLARTEYDLADAVLAVVQPLLAQQLAAGYRQAVADATEANATLGRTRATDQLLATMRDGADLYTRYAAIKTAAAPSATT